ncbi:MAG: hypothetical protein IJI46_07290 [Erysipelotrichaceae bacterium]|nr:hypothetical protein [Erysipelotrichaceae bacterium]
MILSFSCSTGSVYIGSALHPVQEIGHLSVVKLKRAAINEIELDVLVPFILNNAATKLIMKSDATDLQKICNLFQLNDGEQTLIKNSGVGQGLLIAGDMRVYANIEIEPEVLQLCQAGGGK